MSTSLESLRTATPDQWPELIDAPVLAAIFGRSKRTAERWIRAHHFGPPIVIAGKQFLRRKDVLRHIELHREPAKGGRCG